MSMIFPGMDPYLESPLIWPGVHNSLIIYIRDQLQPLLRPRYVAAVEGRVFVQRPDERSIIPDIWVKKDPATSRGGSAAVLEIDDAEMVDLADLEIHENYIEILDIQNNQRIVTVIEVISPTNKCVGNGRTSYLAKQTEVLGSKSHLVEIDLLRTGSHVVALPESAARRRGPYDYLICLNRAKNSRNRFEFYRRTLPQPLPKIAIPLADGDPDIPLDLQAAIAKTYEAGAYRDRLRYDQPCLPPLSAEDQAWAGEVIGNAATNPVSNH
jgi:hypothetical protein